MFKFSLMHCRLHRIKHTLVTASGKGMMAPWSAWKAACGENGASASPGLTPSAAAEQSYSQLMDTLMKHFWFR